MGCHSHDAEERYSEIEWYDNYLKWYVRERDKTFNEEERKQVKRAHKLAETTLDEFKVHRWVVLDEDVGALHVTIENATCEEDIQQFLEEHPEILARHLGTGASRWCLPKKRLGSEYVPDFLLAEVSSIGLEWLGVELENPNAILFNRRGDPSAALTHAIRQITDWRAWLKDNIDYARRPRDKNGLGLVDIDANLRCYILIGRRKDLSDMTRARRRQMNQDLRVNIHTYDWLAEVAEECSRSISENRKEFFRKLYKGEAPFCE